ncbi:hypothetical protein [Streptomyces clavuligerus]|uniref:hypothetical protein n=3 Tax=Streptomyces clavuligerus TaxID=1901 RepID=UPI000185179B|nr:hypothetical protein [Streptomyces clavuligerus]WDN56112.1 hypothetical protein LL058_30075 [Streptomyces clavuligerus]
MRCPDLPPYRPRRPRRPRPGAGEVVIVVVVLAFAGALTVAGLPMFGSIEFLAAVLFIACRALVWLRGGGGREADGV